MVTTPNPGVIHPAALMLQNEMGPESVVATVFPDCNKKYLSTDLMKKESVKTGFLSPDVEIISIKSFKRVCSICCEMIVWKRIIPGILKPSACNVAREGTNPDP